VFNVIISDNFLFSIRVYRFHDCKHGIEEQRMQLGGTVQMMQIEYFACK
jgi:hypothetical protein